MPRPRRATTGNIIPAAASPMAVHITEMAAGDEPIEACFRPDRLAMFWQFVCERQAIWYRRMEMQLPPPWTKDHILQRERFTNMYRELDPGTMYMKQHILELDRPKPDKLFNVMLYRLIGRAETHAVLGFQDLATFDQRTLEEQLKRIRDMEGKPPFTAAYMVSAYTNMGTHDKIVNVSRLFALLAGSFDDFYARIIACEHPSQIYSVLASAQGFGNFLAYQVLVDLLYPLEIYGGKPLLPYSHDDWAAAGPGAQRGIAMLLRPGYAAPHPDDHLAVMRWLRTHQRAELKRIGLKLHFLRNAQGEEQELSLANIQNCLCEYHKYIKIGNGTGRGRRKFTPSSPPQAMQLSLDDLFAAAV